MFFSRVLVSLFGLSLLLTAHSAPIFGQISSVIDSLGDATIEALADAISNIFSSSSSSSSSFFGTPLSSLTNISITSILTGDSDSQTPPSTTPPTATTPDAFVRPAFFSRIAYCSSGAVMALSCGAPCDALGANVAVLQTGGDDGLVPMYLIAHDADADAVVVAHQGTDPAKLLSILNDAEFGLVDLNATRFTSAAGLGVQVHTGFQLTFERTADSMLAGVQAALASTGATNVVTTGHSLGAAIATIDSMFLKQELSPAINVSSTVFGLPRVGNQAWADFISAGLSTSLTHITNQNDPVPIVPPRFLAFQHPPGEVHIAAVDTRGDATDVVACPGEENTGCAEGNSLLDADVANHLGPYFEGISFGGAACPV